MSNKADLIRSGFEEDIAELNSVSDLDATFGPEHEKTRINCSYSLPFLCFSANIVDILPRLSVLCILCGEKISALFIFEYSVTRRGDAAHKSHRL